MCCISHCIPGKRSCLYQRDDPDWVPSVGLTGQQGDSLQLTKETGNSRYKRCMNRTQQRLEAEVAASSAAAADDTTTSDNVSDNFCCTGMMHNQTELTGDVIEAMTTELQNLRTENIQLSSDVAQLSTSYDQMPLLIRMKRFYFSLAYLHTRYS